MNSRLFAAALLLLSAVSIRGAETDELVSPAHKIVPGQSDTAWAPLFAELARRETIAADFTENRYLPIKKIPVVFKGQMRFSRELGLSLHYVDPEDKIVIVDSKGVVTRDPKGRQHETNDAHVQASIVPLLNILRFDEAELSKSFDLYGVRNGDEWTLAFDPRPGELSSKLKRLVVSGRETLVRKIEMRPAAMFGVQILVENARLDAKFSPEETARYFR